MLIDCHIHYRGDRSELKTFMREVERLDMKICLIGSAAPHLGDCAPNGAVAQALDDYPGLLCGFAHVPLGRGGTPNDVERRFEQGFRGIKFIWPADHYDADEYLPVYAKCAELGMVCLFHTGMVGPARPREKGVGTKASSRFMRPVDIDMIAREFLNLKIIIAHLGIPWYNEGAMLLRLHRNVYSDLAGSGIWGYIKPELLREWLDLNGVETVPPDPRKQFYSKLVYGSDAYTCWPHMLQPALDGYKRLMDSLGIADPVRAGIFGGTVAGLLDNES